MLPSPMRSTPSLVFRPAGTDSSARSLHPFLPPLCFHNLTNRFSRKPFIFTSIQIPRGVTLRPSYSRLIRLCGSVSLWQIPCSQQLAASYISLRALFRTPILCFQSFAAAFPKTPGVGGTCPSDIPTFRRFDFQTVRRAVRSATWTRFAHPTIIAARSTFQDHG
jgi:hypothetical protein